MAKRKWRRAPRSHVRLDLQGAPPARMTRARGPGGRGTSWLGSLLLLGLAILFLARFMTDGRFRVAEVTIRGANLVTSEQVETRADLMGMQIFAVNAHQVEEHLLETFGLLERAAVQTRLPDRVLIHVSEQDTLLLWSSEGNLWWVDAQGLVLGVAPSRGELVALHDRSGLDVTPGEYLVGVPWAFVAEMSRALPTVRDFEFTLEDGLILIVADGWPVYLGVSGDAVHKAAVLEELTEALGARGERVVYIDLKNERVPVVKVQSE